MLTTLNFVLAVLSEFYQNVIVGVFGKQLSRKSFPHQIFSLQINLLIYVQYYISFVLSSLDGPKFAFKLTCKLKNSFC